MPGDEIDLTVPRHDFKDLDFRICHVLNHGRHFGPEQASSVDLCTRELVVASCYSQSTAVLAPEVDVTFNDVVAISFPEKLWQRTQVRAATAARWAFANDPDIIVVQEHLPTAAAIATLVPHLPVVLQTHTFQKSYPPERNLFNELRRVFKSARYKRLAGIAHVSEACERRFSQLWPDIHLSQAVIPNGLDFASWRPTRSRKNEVIFVGRCVPDKGGLIAAKGIARALAAHPDWAAMIVLSRCDNDASYFREVFETLAPLGERARIHENLPHAQVRKLFERAAIAIVPSVWEEPFGRTALEAHAGGAALISSGTGGLKEVSGDGALYLDTVSPDCVQSAVSKLISEPAYRSLLAARGRNWACARFDIELVSTKFDLWLEQVVRAWQSHQKAPPRRLWSTPTLGTDQRA